jgi:cytochrome P450
MTDTPNFRELTVTPGLDPSRPRPPEVRAWPLVGSSLAFLRDPVRYLLRAYREHGPVYRMRLGPQAFTVLAGPEGCGFVTREGRTLVTAEGVWGDTARILGADARAIVTNVDGERHTELRGILRAGMSKSAAFETLARSLELVEEALGAAARRGRPVDAVEFARGLVFTQLGHAMAGAAPPPMFGAADTVLRAIVRGTRVPALRRLPLRPKVREAARDVAEISADLLASRSIAHPTFVRDVLEGLRAGVYGERDLPALMVTPYIAGLDTMAHTFGFVLYRLARHPEWRLRLRDEVDRAVAATGRLDADAVGLCVELGYFVQEVMRVHPLSPAVIRAARSDFALDGMQIHAGESILGAHTVTHFMHELYPDPERFDPLRFHPDRAEHRGALRFAPFGIGAHVCLGAGTAEVLLRANAAAFLHHAELASADPRYELRVSNLSGACPVGFAIRIGARAPSSAARPAVERRAAS